MRILATHGTLLPWVMCGMYVVQNTSNGDPVSKPSTPHLARSASCHSLLRFSEFARRPAEVRRVIVVCCSLFLSRMTSLRVLGVVVALCCCFCLWLFVADRVLRSLSFFLATLGCCSLLFYVSLCFVLVCLLWRILVSCHFLFYVVSWCFMRALWTNERAEFYWIVGRDKGSSCSGRVLHIFFVPCPLAQARWLHGR